MRNESWISRVRQSTLVDSTRSSYSYYSNFDRISLSIVHWYSTVRNCAAYSIRCTRYASWRTFRASPHGSSGPFPFCKCAASSRSPIFFFFFSISFFFSLFFFPRASAANWSQRRHGVSSVLPFSSCACRRPSRSALVLQHGRPRRRMVTRATNATRRAIPQAILRSRTFLLSLFLAVCARSLCRPNEPDRLRAFDFTTAETKAASRRLPIERFRPILLNIIASGTTTIYLFPRCIAAEVAISWYRACTRSFDTSSFVLLLGNDLTKDRDATSSLDESRLESLS